MELFEAGRLDALFDMWEVGRMGPLGDFKDDPLGAVLEDEAADPRGADAGLGRLASFDGCPEGPPGRSNFPCVTGRPGFGLGFGVGRDTELGGSP